MTWQRVAVVAVGVGVLLAGRAVGGYAGAAIAGAGIGGAVLGLGRRRPHMLRRRHDEDEDATDPDRWSQW